MAEILENIETIKLDPKDEKIKKFIDFAYFSGGIIGAGGPFVKWKELLNYLFGSNQIPYNKDLFYLIQETDYKLWEKWNLAFSYHEEMELGLITKEEWDKMMNEIEEEISQKYGDRLVKIEVNGIDKIYCLKPIPKNIKNKKGGVKCSQKHKTCLNKIL